MSLIDFVVCYFFFFSHQDYKKALVEQVASFATGYNIESNNHQLYTVEYNKQTLNPYNDKASGAGVGKRCCCFIFFFLYLLLGLCLPV